MIPPYRPGTRLVGCALAVALVLGATTTATAQRIERKLIDLTAIPTSEAYSVALRASSASCRRRSATVISTDATLTHIETSTMTMILRLMPHLSSQFGIYRPTSYSVLPGFSSIRRIPSRRRRIVAVVTLGWW